MKVMGLEAIYSKPSLSKRDMAHEIYPYRLRGVEILRVNQIWRTDITNVRREKGLVYLVAIIDWHSRFMS